MPFYSSVRKSSAATGVGDANASFHANGSNGIPRPPRTHASGRAVRATTTRPANYYAPPFGNASGLADRDSNADSAGPVQPQGFYPGITYFTDAITALPKEVQKHFTLMKEVEAKIHGPTEQIGHIIDQIMEMPVPRRKDTARSTAPNASAPGLLSLTADHSASGSANVSLTNGQAGRHSAHASVNGSLDGEAQVENEEHRQKRLKCYELRAMTNGLLANLDEKIVVLSEANRVLRLQHSRLDSVKSQLDIEIPEEARLGSMTHWAYSDNRQKTKAIASGVSKPRDVAAMNSLAVAGDMLHEQEIANVRTNAVKEATREKRGGKRAEHAGDSDFDDKLRKVAKIGKGRVAGGLGTSTNAEPAAKRRKPGDKSLGAPGMERTISAPGKAAKGRETPRSTPAAEPAAKTKATKAKPGLTGPKRKMPASAQNSPMLASSPLAASFSPAIAAASLEARPINSRMRQNSSATNLRHERLQDEDISASQPSSATSEKPAPKTNGKRKVQETTEEHEQITGENASELARQQSEKLKREDTEMRYGSGNEQDRPVNSRSGSSSQKNSGRNTKVSTPRTEAFPTSTALTGEALARSRSTRSKPGDRDGSSSEPQTQGSTMRKGLHKRSASNSHLVKQLAPFNKSPNLDRDTMDEEDADSDDEDKEGREEEDLNEEDGGEEEGEARRVRARRPVSRRNTVNATTLRTSPAPISRDSSPPASPPTTATRQNTRSTQRGAAAPLKEHTPPLAHDEEDESEHDPDDPDEPKYCYCNRGSYGEMVACDNDNCPKEWFHLGCTELKEAPEEEEKWYCRDCRPKGRGGRGGARGGRGRLA